MIGCKCNALHVAFNFYLPLSPPSGSVRFRGSFASALLHLFPPSTPPRTLSCLLETCLFNFFATNCVSWLSYSNGVRVHYAFSLCHPHIICSRPLSSSDLSFHLCLSSFSILHLAHQSVHQCPSFILSVLAVLHFVRRSSFCRLSYMRTAPSASVMFVRQSVRLSICPHLHACPSFLIVVRFSFRPPHLHFLCLSIQCMFGDRMSGQFA